MRLAEPISRHQVLPGNVPTSSISYSREAADNWPAPGPGTAPTSTTLSTFTGDPNGVSGNYTSPMMPVVMWEV